MRTAPRGRRAKGAHTLVAGVSVPSERGAEGRGATMLGKAKMESLGRLELDLLESCVAREESQTMVG